ncbi:hypothetical protein ROZALSC1DRAFT_29556 [Rozella allomycis CSF55]|uniref:Uncharacterized protein n=1 Tax=Rozella allomycis (strain CSF55) TaxID=988480 RepID=A0A075AZS3_ROZAC|nr:hypothetical protein O9G_004069 [Rozella allomycis CSF55]RKP18796.1 hypothetical protein ROZALSC1DRAFT_29556 [Rozella allomycis CSF55]|eukprot:EPZ34192.1 hypothetical protein O9G_004069 [Rozella allomycis CSF55]
MVTLTKGIAIPRAAYITAGITLSAIVYKKLQSRKSKGKADKLASSNMYTKYLFYSVKDKKLCVKKHYC